MWWYVLTALMGQRQKWLTEIQRVLREGGKESRELRWKLLEQEVKLSQLKRQLKLLEERKLKWMQLKFMLALKTKSKGGNWFAALGWFIPRKYRNDIIGDILEDCAEMREAGCTERQIKFHVVYQWLLAVVTLVPASIIGILKQVQSPLK